VREGLLDLLAHKLGLDPLELRLKNIPPGENRAALVDTLRAVAEKAGWSSADRERPSEPGKRRGWGLAAGEWTNWVGCSAATVILNENGSFEVLMGSVNLTGTSTIFAQIAAEELGVPMESVTVTMGDTDSVPYHDVSGGSRTAYATGTAVQRAAQEVRRQLLRRGAALLEATPEEVEIAEGSVRKREDPEEAVTFAELGQMSIRTPEGPIQGSSGLGDWPSRTAHAAQIAEVEVDVETGQVRVLRFVAAQDVGRALNPLSVEGQIQGAVAQGIGWALWEGYRYNPEGRLTNPNLTDYPIATSYDLPPIETVLVETHPADGPYGAKGVGEPPIIPAPAAVMNAVADALGVPVGELPLTPERVVRAMER
jgi:CO/xanthine dehydrogenase Mo-binding subunit